jgi:hypothetical protein
MFHNFNISKHSSIKVEPSEAIKNPIDTIDEGLYVNGELISSRKYEIHISAEEAKNLRREAGYEDDRAGGGVIVGFDPLDQNLIS